MFQEKWDISIVADTLPPRIARPSGLTKLDKRPIPAESYHYMYAHDCSLTDII